jgi:hypothetical protein
MPAEHPAADQSMDLGDSDDEPIYSTPPELAADALALRGDVLPTASTNQYINEYVKFKTWFFSQAGHARHRRIHVSDRVIEALQRR